MHAFCTYFDRDYLPRGLALYRSLKQHCPAFRLWVLCMDHDCYGALEQLRLPELHLITLEELEATEPRLLEGKRNRSRIEYYFTCTPALPLHVLQQHADVNVITYLDSDLFFFAGPAPLFDEMGKNSIAIIPHRFAPHLREMERNGIYNVGWISFRRDTRGFACLEWWRDRCLEWCYDRPEQGRYADQKYLDDWPSRFAGVVVLSHKGANLAPWNVSNHELSERDGHVWVDEQPLIFFHFQGLKQIRHWLFDTNMAGYHVRPERIVMQRIYTPYIQTLRDIARTIALPRGIRYKELRLPLWRRVVYRLKRIVRACRGLFNRNYIVLFYASRLRS
jgi:hypothetical protein